MIRTALAAIVVGTLLAAATPAVAEQPHANPTVAAFLATASAQTPVTQVRRYVYYGAPGWYGYVGPPAYSYYGYQPYVGYYTPTPQYYSGYYPGYGYTYPYGTYYSGPYASYYYGY
jgi:hypothetical protein